jgi:hypothetical protein
MSLSGVMSILYITEILGVSVLVQKANNKGISYENKGFKLHTKKQRARL